MTDKFSSKIDDPVGALPPCPTTPPSRILVVDDEPVIRALNTKMLFAAGYHVDSAEDGAVAWDALQLKPYDLIITDNNMPKVSGVELIEKVRAAGMSLPVIMATGTPPEAEFARRRSPKPAATLLKPYTFTQLLGTVRNVLCGIIAMVMLQWCLIASGNAQDSLQPPSGLRFVSSGGAQPTQAVAFSVAANSAINDQESKQIQGLPLPASVGAPTPSAMTLSVRGQCEYSDDGVTFSKLERTHVLEQGAIVRTGEEARADLFFRRTGTTVRLQPGTTMKLEKMTISTKDGLPIVHTLLDLRAGRIFTVVRSEVVGSTLEIRNAAGRAVLEGSGIGRYIITADGTHVAAEGSAIPIKVVGENGITIVAAGQQFDKKNGKMLPVDSNSWVKELIELDQLQAATDGLAQRDPSPKP